MCCYCLALVMVEFRQGEKPFISHWHGRYFVVGKSVISPPYFFFLSLPLLFGAFDMSRHTVCETQLWTLTIVQKCTVTFPEGATYNEKRILLVWNFCFQRVFI